MCLRHPQAVGCASGAEEGARLHVVVTVNRNGSRFSTSFMGIVLATPLSIQDSGCGGVDGRWIALGLRKGAGASHPGDATATDSIFEI